MGVSYLNQVASRRRVLQMAVTGTVVGLLTGGRELAFPPEAQAQSTLSPDAALAELMDGNKRFTTGRMAAHEHDLAILKQNTIEKQEPFAAVKLSCADSRADQKWRVTPEPVIGPRFARPRWANPPHALRPASFIQRSGSSLIPSGSIRLYYARWA